MRGKQQQQQEQQEVDYKLIICMCLQLLHHLESRLGGSIDPKQSHMYPKSVQYEADKGQRLPLKKGEVSRFAPTERTIDFFFVVCHC